MAHVDSIPQASPRTGGLLSGVGEWLRRREGAEAGAPSPAPQAGSSDRDRPLAPQRVPAAQPSGWNRLVALTFSLRCWISCMLALYVAFFLQLDAPYWAGLTVWMVAQPTPGMAISKGFYRIIGTLAGSVMGVVLMALFAQTPELFIGALALWIAATTVASNLMRNFRSYSAVLAGYTAAIVALGSYSNPQHVLEIAFARGTATIIGIACSALVTSLVARHETYGKVMKRLRTVMGTMAQRGAVPAQSPLEEKLVIGRPLIVELIALDTEIEFAAAEAAEFRIHADTARSLLAHLFGALSAKRSMDDRLVRTRLAPDSELGQFLQSVTGLLERGPALMHAGREAELAEEIKDLREELRELAPEEKTETMEMAVAERVIVDRLDDLLRHLAEALSDWTGLQGGWKRTVGLQLNFHRDHRAAWINGTRAFLAVVAAGIFWVASAWSSGPGMIIQAGVVCSLFSALPRPDRAGFSFLIGALISLPCAFVINFYVLQNVSGFPLLAVSLGLFLVPAACFFLSPKFGLISLASCVNFFAISRPLNPMNYDVVSFLNNGVATIIGTAFGVLAYKLFLPPDPQAARRYVVKRIKRGLELIAERNPIPPAWTWQTRMFDRVNRLHDPANLSGTSTDEWLEHGLAALNLGNEVLRLRLLLRDEPVDEREAKLARQVVEGFTRLRSRPGELVEAVEAAQEGLAAEPPRGEAAARRTWLRLRGMLEEMEVFFKEYPRFLLKEGKALTECHERG
jgi:uncharacterized membrane protein YccC